MTNLASLLAAARDRRERIQEQEAVDNAVLEAEEAARFAEYDASLTLLCHILHATQLDPHEVRQLALSLLAEYHEVAWQRTKIIIPDIASFSVPVALARIAPVWACNIYHPVAYLYDSPPPYPCIDRAFLPPLQSYIEARIIQTYLTLQTKK